MRVNTSSTPGSNKCCCYSLSRQSNSTAGEKVVKYSESQSISLENHEGNGKYHIYGEKGVEITFSHIISVDQH
jgi:hypothetical protein